MTRASAVFDIWIRLKKFLWNLTWLRTFEQCKNGLKYCIHLHRPHIRPTRRNCCPLSLETHQIICSVVFALCTSWIIAPECRVNSRVVNKSLIQISPYKVYIIPYIISHKTIWWCMVECRCYREIPYKLCAKS